MVIFNIIPIQVVRCLSSQGDVPVAPAAPSPSAQGEVRAAQPRTSRCELLSFTRNPWENHRKKWGSYGKIIGQPWEKHRKMGKS